MIKLKHLQGNMTREITVSKASRVQVIKLKDWAQLIRAPLTKRCFSRNMETSLRLLTGEDLQWQGWRQPHPNRILSLNPMTWAKAAGNQPCQRCSASSTLANPQLRSQATASRFELQWSLTWSMGKTPNSITSVRQTIWRMSLCKILTIICHRSEELHIENLREQPEDWVSCSRALEMIGESASSRWERKRMLSRRRMRKGMRVSKREFSH